jgi:hypothetical protein
VERDLEPVVRVTRLSPDGQREQREHPDGSPRQRPEPPLPPPTDEDDGTSLIDIKV